MKPLLVSSGEPAGIGPDICLALAATTDPIVVMGDRDVLQKRAEMLGLTIKFREYQDNLTRESERGTLSVLHLSCKEPVIPGVLNKNNAAYVLDMLTMGARLCQENVCAALITAPVHKGIINDADISFTGHTEFFADYFQVPTVVMLLACKFFKVALVTTHLALKDVPAAITSEKIKQVVTCLVTALEQDFAIQTPHIFVAGLNPHAGEGGHLGREEIDIIAPPLHALRTQGMQISGPLSADTLFNRNNLEKAHAFVAMYHDQGLPVLKYAGFGDAVNITLGLPIIRTSVDHGTALDLAGTGSAKPDSLLAAIDMAATMARNRKKKHDNDKLDSSS